MTFKVHNADNAEVQLSDNPIASGGEASVYAVKKWDRVVVKIYHDQVLAKREKELRRKIDAMSTDQKFSKFKKDENYGLSWPHFAVYDDHGRWRGYAMRRANGVIMSKLAHAMAYKEHFPNLDRLSIASYLLNLLGTIEELHSLGVMIGDYNLENFLCVPNSSEIHLIDCDSWQVDTKNGTFYCPVTVPDMIPRELQGKDLSTVRRTPESEYFSISILIFKTLMLGRHPYDVVGGADPVSNIKNGYFPYGKGGGGIPKGPWYNIWSHLPFKLKELFIRTFKDGALDPSKRASISEWIDKLKIYKREMEKGRHDIHIKPDSPKSSNYRGKQSISNVD